MPHGARGEPISPACLISTRCFGPTVSKTESFSTRPLPALESIDRRRRPARLLTSPPDLRPIRHTLWRLCAAQPLSRCSLYPILRARRLSLLLPRPALQWGLVMAVFRPPTTLNACFALSLRPNFRHRPRRSGNFAGLAGSITYLVIYRSEMPILRLGPICLWSGDGAG